jgi:hypothetical protein
LTNLEKVHSYFSQFESPEIFITWDYLYIIASCLGRKVWLQGEVPIYPNIFVIIVGPPAVGKSLPARTLADIITPLQKFDERGNAHDLVNITPTCVTLEKLYDFLEKCGDAVKMKNGGPPGWTPSTEAPNPPPYFHSSASFLMADELGMLFKKSDKTKDTILFLNGGFDCMRKFKYETKTKGLNVVTNLCVNFFGCATDRWIADNLSSSVIDEGFASRCFFVWGDTKRQFTTFYKFDAGQKAHLKELEKHFRDVSQVCGEVTLSQEAYEYLDNWYQKSEGGKKFRINNDSKLDHYYGRKKLALIKLAILLHYSETTTTNVVSLATMQHAFKLAAETEVNMHRALASINVNPSAKIADDIKRELKEVGPLTKAEILCKFFGRASGGKAMIDEAMNYLHLDTAQIRLGSGGKYELIEKVVAVDFKKPLVEKTTAEVKEEIRKASEA